MKARKSGMMLSEIPFTNMPVLLKNVGMDFIILDFEHGSFDYSDISKIIMSARLSMIEVIIRLADNTRKDITKFMDMGADGVMVQMTNNAEDIKKVVEYAKYAPLGKRGISTMRAHSFYNPPELLEYMKIANEHTKVFAQIETINGLKNINEILSVDGVDGYFLGPNDMSCEMNCLDDENAKSILDAIDTLHNAAIKQNKISGVITSNKNYITKAKEVGMGYFSVGSELSMLKKASAETIKMIQG